MRPVVRIIFGGNKTLKKNRTKTRKQRNQHPTIRFCCISKHKYQCCRYLFCLDEETNTKQSFPCFTDIHRSDNSKANFVLFSYFGQHMFVFTMMVLLLHVLMWSDNYSAFAAQGEFIIFLLLHHFTWFHLALLFLLLFF